MSFTKIFPDKDQVELELNKLIPFANCPFDFFAKGKRFDDMVDEVRSIGICQPIIVRPTSHNKYEILNGHYRVAAAKELNLLTVPALVLEGLTDENALSYVSDTNPIGLLLKHGINIYNDNYKESNEYKSIENVRVSFEDKFSMALDEYIERFLLTDFEIHGFYESVYSMGDSSELTEEECGYEALAREIIQITDPGMDPNIKQKIRQWEESKKLENIKKADIEKGRESDRIEDKVNITIRQLRDYTRQLKKYLNIDLTSFDYSNIQNKREKAKILYFIFMLKKEFCHIDILELLSKPSMENIDNSFLGWETSNGKYIKAVKHSIEKEISLIQKNNIKEAASYVVNKWGSYMQNMLEEMEYLEEKGYDISNYTNLLQSAINEPFLPEKNKESLFLPPNPVGILYLRLIQHEYLGQMKDLLTVYGLQDNTEYYVPPEYVKEMIGFQTKQLKQDDFNEYFEAENVQQIAKYVYLKSETNKEERRRIRECKGKVLKLLSFLSLADTEANVMDDLTELLIISCLQSIILEERNEVFEYAFHKFEGEKGKRKGKIYVQAALKNDRRVYDALQVYWVHRVKNHLYANTGNYKLREKMRETEKLCVKTLEKILSCSTVEEMLSMHSFYSQRLTE